MLSKTWLILEQTLSLVCLRTVKCLRTMLRLKPLTFVFAPKDDRLGPGGLVCLFMGPWSLRVWVMQENSLALVWPVGCVSLPFAGLHLLHERALRSPLIPKQSYGVWSLVPTGEHGKVMLHQHALEERRERGGEHCIFSSSQSVRCSN